MTRRFVRFIAGSSLALATLGPVTAPAAIAASAPQGVSQQIRSASSGKFRKFYKARNFLPIWARKGTIGPEADAFIALLRASRRDGLDPSDYAPDALKQAVDLTRSGAPNLLAVYVGTGIGYLTTSGDAPGYEARTTIVGGTTSGYCATGSET